MRKSEKVTINFLMFIFSIGVITILAIIIKLIFVLILYIGTLKI